MFGSMWRRSTLAYKTGYKSERERGHEYMPVRNRQIRELISAPKTSHEHNNKNLSNSPAYTRYITPPKGGCTLGGVYVPCIYFICQVTFAIGDSGLCCCVRVTSFERHNIIISYSRVCCRHG